MAYVRSLLGFALVVPALGITALAACGGATVEPSDSPSKVVSGEECTDEGQVSAADDGCNTCACTDGTWSCTKKACLPGAGGAAGTGGNPAATGGKPAIGGAPGAGGKPAAGGVTGTGGTDPLCKPGPSPDGCNECSCVNGQRVCTDRACPEPVCKPGESKFDGCNTCKCADGQWACTRMACPVADAGAPKGCGGWLGDTCSDAEYCAYVAGQHCGAADASATCQPRPMACDAIYKPVCGCNGVTFGNACEAAMKGTGVLSDGPCSGR